MVAVGIPVATLIAAAAAASVANSAEEAVQNVPGASVAEVSVRPIGV